jgi:hypothetical protein
LRVFITYTRGQSSRTTRRDDVEAPDDLGDEKRDERDREIGGYPGHRIPWNATPSD